MSYIKKLTIEGFKIFGKKVEFSFEKGINTIIGPNGSGKSCVIDAFCFVFGKPEGISKKNMRFRGFGNIENIIFAGMGKIKPSKEAIVELTFDNKKNTFPFNTKEITIRRILKRNGKDEYAINDKIFSIEDVKIILRKSGIDSNTIIMNDDLNRLESINKEIIEKIAHKGKFKPALKRISKLFKRNLLEFKLPFSASLELNPHNTIEIILKFKKFYTDIYYLSSGERRMVFLSLFFALCEYEHLSPLVFDEIDCSFDRKNSQRFSSLVLSNVKSGQQFIIATHNDALIPPAQTIHGLDVKKGIPKVIELRIKRSKR